jgi:2-dehydro-3-deoxygluconokinase
LFDDLVQHCDVLFGNADQFAVCLGYELDARRSPLESARHSLDWLRRKYPKLRGAFCTTRFASDASHHRWGAIGCWEGTTYEVPESSVAVYDRVGGGDAAAAGYLYGLLAGKGLEWACRCAVTHGAMAMSTPGDASMVTLPEIEQAMSSDQVRMQR